MHVFHLFLRIPLSQPRKFALDGYLWGPRIARSRGHCVGTEIIGPMSGGREDRVPASGQQISKSAFFAFSLSFCELHSSGQERRVVFPEGLEQAEFSMNQ